MSVSVTPQPSWLAPYHPDLSRKPDLREVDNGYYEVLYEEQHHVEKQTVYKHVVRRIISEAGVQNGAEISVEYRPAYERLYFHRVQLRRNGKVISILDPSKFKFLQQEKDLAQYIYTGTATALLFPEDVRKDDELEYAYSIVGRNPIFENKYFNSFYFSAEGPVLNYYCSLIVSPKRELSFNSMNDAPEPTEKTWNGNKLYEWDLGDSLATDSDDESVKGYPYVQVTEYNSWQQVIEWAKRINYTAANGKNIRAKIAELKAAAGSDTLKYITSAIRFVQDDIRYMGIEMGEYSHRPNDPDKVLVQRFGDCKDKSLLLSTILKAQGIDAYMAYVNTYLEGGVSDLEPTPYAFNHCIVKMDFRDEEYWIDPTIAYQRGPIDKRGSLPYGAALVIGDGSESLSYIEHKNYGVMKVWEQFYLSPNNYTATLLKVKTDYTGSYADEIRAQFAATSIGSQERGFRNFYGKTYDGVKVKDSLWVEDKEDENIFRTYESYGIGQAWVYDTASNNGTLSFSSHIRSLAEEIPYISSSFGRTSLSQKFPSSIEYEVELHLPISWTNAPKSVHVKNAYFQYDFDATVTGKVMTLKYKYETFTDVIPAEHLEEYVSEVAAIAGSVNLLFTYNPEGALDKPSGGVPGDDWNWLMITLAAFFLLLFAGMSILFYNRSVLPLKDSIDPRPINGWLVLLGIGVAFRPLYLLLALLGMDTFYYSIWVAVTKLAGGGNASLLQLGLAALVFAQVMLFVYAVLLCFLFFGRRDTFPRAMIAFYILQVIVFAVIRLMPASLLPHQTLVHEGITEIFVLAMAALWIPYLLGSQRVKTTFVFPHASKLVYATVASDEAGVTGDVLPAEAGVPEGSAVDGHVLSAATGPSNDIVVNGGIAVVVSNAAVVNGHVSPERAVSSNGVAANGHVSLPTKASSNGAAANGQASLPTKASSNGAAVNGHTSPETAAPSNGQVAPTTTALSNGYTSPVTVASSNGAAVNGHTSPETATPLNGQVSPTTTVLSNGYASPVTVAPSNGAAVNGHTSPETAAPSNGQVSPTTTTPSNGYTSPVTVAPSNGATANGHTPPETTAPSNGQVSPATTAPSNSPALNGNVPPATTVPANDDATPDDAIESLWATKARANQEKKPASAADDILATIRAMKCQKEVKEVPAYEPVARLPRETSGVPSLSVYTQVQDVSPENSNTVSGTQDDTVADNILKTIRFLHALRNQEGGEMDRPNILLLHEEWEEKKESAADSINKMKNGNALPEEAPPGDGAPKA